MIVQYSVHRIAMSFSATTAAEQVNMDTLLPTHIRLRRAHTFPTLESHSSYHQTIHSPTDNVATASCIKKWFIHVKEYATVIGVVVGIIGVIVAIITVVLK